MTVYPPSRVPRSGRALAYRAAASLSTLALLGIFGWSSAVRAQVRQLPVVFHVASVNGSPALDGEQLEGWLAVVNQHFAAADIGFTLSETRALPTEHAVLENIRSRRRLATRLRAHRVNVFVVDQILDPTPSASTRRAAAARGWEPSGRLSGAHIPAKGRAPGTYIIVTRGAGALSLAHELGHFLSAPHHSDPANIMSYGRERTSFDEHQLRAFRHRARRYLRERALRPPRD